MEHNTHYYDIALEAAPSTARTALDVGTGDGLLAVRLADKILRFTSIDSDADIIARAQSGAPDNITWTTGDALNYPLPEAHYDLVVAVAAVHHFPDFAAGLGRLASLVAPDGALVVIGCARSSSLHDYAHDLMGIVQHQVCDRMGQSLRHRLRKEVVRKARSWQGR